MADFNMAEAAPASPEMDNEDFGLEGEEYGAPEEEASPIDSITAQFAELSKEDLKKVEAALAEEISRKEEEEGNEELAEDDTAAPEEDNEKPDEGGGDLSSMFG